MSENQLADELLNWYWTNKSKITNNPRFWAQNSIGYAISSIVKEQKRWRNAPRGKQDIKHFTPVNEFDVDF